MRKTMHDFQDKVLLLQSMIVPILGWVVADRGVPNGAVVSESEYAGPFAGKRAYASGHVAG